ncbi:YdeI/OmpD-associated family protein [Candidatus Nomurabacteria bacterium]|nr:YdeI/OmpD-associated family protein [Candidatus Nomurabacteria bacterium]
MGKKEIARLAHRKFATGTVHKIPKDLQKAIASTKATQALWEDITPLARNEWICWVISGKKMETRNIRIKKAISKMSGGMRRPCCWAGCTHR